MAASVTIAAAKQQAAADLRQGSRGSDYRINSNARAQKLAILPPGIDGRAAAALATVRSPRETPGLRILLREREASGGSERLQRSGKVGVGAARGGPGQLGEGSGARPACPVARPHRGAELLLKTFPAP